MTHVPGWAGFLDQYQLIMSQLPVGAVMVEVGCYHGRSVLWAAEHALSLGRKDIQIWAVDSWSGQFEGAHAGFRHNLQAHLASGLVRELHRPSLEASVQFPAHSLDYVFIDADHSQHSVAEDIQAWWPRVRPGGWLGGDDHSVGAANGVAQAVTEFADHERLEVLRLPNRKNHGGVSRKVCNWLVQRPI